MYFSYGAEGSLGPDCPGVVQTEVNVLEPWGVAQPQAARRCFDIFDAKCLLARSGLAAPRLIGPQVRGLTLPFIAATVKAVRRRSSISLGAIALFGESKASQLPNCQGSTEVGYRCNPVVCRFQAVPVRSCIASKGKASYGKGSKARVVPYLSSPSRVVTPSLVHAFRSGCQRVKAGECFTLGAVPGRLRNPG